MSAFFSCYKETPIEVKASFDISYVKNDQSVPVNVLIRNTSENADSFQWTFEGADIKSSQDENPSAVGYSKAGKYKIKLKVSNVDNQEDTYEQDVIIYEKIDIKYKTSIIKNNYPPVEVKIDNSTIGNTLSYKWTFENANILSSQEKNPQNISFEEPGKHKIKLTVSNGFESFSKDTVIEVKPKIIGGFDWDVAYFDDDYQAPVNITMKNNSKNVISYQWSFQNGEPSTSTDENPKVKFDKAGDHKITLKVSNGKYEKVITKQIKVLPDTNIRLYENLKFGVNYAHQNNLIGAFFSSDLRKVLKQEDLKKDMVSKIDIAFFGINESFSYAKFVSPDDVGNNGFADLKNANKTIIINSQDKCFCGNLSVSDFDNMTNDEPLKKLTITETKNGLLHFDNTIVPRIVLFKTTDGRKGAIKIKRFVKNGSKSYIDCDIKMQKLPN